MRKMSEEEKQAIEYFENLDIDLNTLCRIDLKGLEKRRKQILNLIDKQQKEIEELKNINKKLNCENQKLFEETVEQQKEIELSTKSYDKALDMLVDKDNKIKEKMQA